MDPIHSVTRWIASLRGGNPEAARELHKRFFHRLARLARNRMRGLPRQVADEEDVAQSALKSFFRCVAVGRYERLTDEGSLWALLVAITAHKVSHLRRYTSR